MSHVIKYIKDSVYTTEVAKGEVPTNVSRDVTNILSELSGAPPRMLEYFAAQRVINLTHKPYFSPTPNCSLIRFHVIVILFRYS